MAGAAYSQTSFLGGEWSKAQQGRFDLPTYRSAMNVCLNGFPIEQGAWTRRSGFRHAGTTRNGLAGRNINFDFKRGAPYTMELTDAHLRFRNGPQIVYANDTQTVVSISSATPAKVKTGTHGWSSGQQVQFNALGVNNPLLQNRTFTITITSATEFTIADAVTGADIDGSTLGTFVSGTVSRILEFDTPYVGVTWSTVRSVQTDIQTSRGSSVAAVLLHGSYRSQLLKVLTEPNDTDAATFSFESVDLKDGPYLDPVPGGTLVTPSAVNGLVTLTLSFNAYDSARAYTIGDYVTSSSVNYKSLVDANLGNTPASSPSEWEPVSAADAIGPDGFVGGDVGRLVRLYSEPSEWASGTSYSAGQTIRFGDPSLYWKSLVGSNLGNQPGIDPTKWAIDTAGARWTWGRITSLSNVIDPALSGSVNIGDMTDNGGLAAAFDGILSQTEAQSAGKRVDGSGLPFPSIVQLSSYVGKDYSGASDQVVGQAIVYPASDIGFSAGVFTAADSGAAFAFPVNIELHLRGSATVPSSPSDGTLLATSGVISNTAIPQILVSSDQTTAWKYVWVEQISSALMGYAPGATTYNLRNSIAELSLFNPTGTGTSQGVVAQILGDPLLYVSAIRTWRLGVYSNTTGWPTCGTYHEGRLWLSGVIGNRIDGSKSNDPFNMAPTEVNGAVSPNNAISYVFNSKDVNPIFWMESDDLGIVCGTPAGEWLVQATTLNAPLTPTTIQAHRVTRNGCANIEPRRTDLTLAVVQRFKRKTLEYFADVFRGKFTAQNLSLFSKHLNVTGIEELAYQQELAPLVWHRMGDGSLTGITYKRDSLVSSQPPTFMAAHRHTLGSGRTVESIAVGGSTDGTLDSLYLVTTDAATNIRHVEVLATNFDEGDLLKNAFCLDNAIVPSSSVVGADFTINGLWPHEGKSVTVFAGGLDCGEWTVSDGSVVVTFGDGISSGTGGGLFTSEFVSSFSGDMPIVVGFNYTSQGQLVRPATPQESGARNGPALGKKRRNHQYAALLSNAVTGVVKFGTNLAGTLRAAVFKSNGGTNYSPLTLFNGVYWDTIEDDYSFDGMICWQIAKPFPLTVAAVEGFIETQDK